MIHTFPFSFPFPQKLLTSTVFDALKILLPLDGTQGSKFGKLLTLLSDFAWGTLGVREGKVLAPYKHDGVDSLQNQIIPLGKNMSTDGFHY